MIHNYGDEAVPGQHFSPRIPLTSLLAALLVGKRCEQVQQPNGRTSSLKFVVAVPSSSWWFVVAIRKGSF